MSLWDHISPQQREQMAEMLQPPLEHRLVFKNYYLAIDGEQHIVELFSKSRLHTLMPFSEVICGLRKGRCRCMQIVTSLAEGVIGIRISGSEFEEPLFQPKVFSVPKHALNQVANEIGSFVWMVPGEQHLPDS